MSRRTLGTLSRRDLGKRIAFKSLNDRHVEGVLRSFSHGIYSNTSRGEVDRPLVMVTIAPQHKTQIVSPFGAESHWGEPETRAEVTPTPVECPDCHGDGATYTQVRVGQHATPFICATCDGDGEVSG